MLIDAVVVKIWDQLPQYSRKDPLKPISLLHLRTFPDSRGQIPGPEKNLLYQGHTRCLKGNLKPDFRAFTEVGCCKFPIEC